MHIYRQMKQTQHFYQQCQSQQPQGSLIHYKQEVQTFMKKYTAKCMLEYPNFLHPELSLGVMSRQRIVMIPCYRPAVTSE